MRWATAVLVVLFFSGGSFCAMAQDCAVVSSDARGVPVRIKCGELQLYAQTPAQVADCRLWKKEAQIGERTLSLLERSQLHAQDLLEARDRLYVQLQAQDDLVDMWESEADSRWTFLEVVGVSGIAAGVGVVVGIVLGVWAI